MSESRQIQSMIDFIEREALEKAEELDSAAQEEYDVEKMRLVEAEKAKIRTNLEKKKKQVDVDRRVSRANFAKTQRLRVMEARATTMEQLEALTREKIVAMVNDSSVYRTMLNDIIRQSVQAIRANVIVQVRKEDESTVKGMLKDVEKWYQSTAGSPITIQLSQDYLNGEQVWGGVVAKSTDGRIVCDNTLAYRMKNCFTEQLPTVRYNLFNSEAQLTA